MRLAEQIVALLQEGLSSTRLEVVDESHLHARGMETHFRVLVVSPVFAGERPVARHRRVYALLNPVLRSSLHALSLHLFTPEEFAARQGKVEPSPACQGGSKVDPLFKPTRSS